MRGATSNTPRPPIDHGISIHAPHAGRDQLFFPTLLLLSLFQSTRPMRGATRARSLFVAQQCYFNPRAPCGARQPPPRQARPCLHFNPRAPCGARHENNFWFGACQPNFNPRAPCGARQIGNSPYSKPINFNPRAPCEARQLFPLHELSTSEFQSTRPMRGATGYGKTYALRQYAFQSTRPMRGATFQIEPEALVELFQSTRPMRGATPESEVKNLAGRKISIHAPHAGRDLCQARGSCRPHHFNPRAPCGARLSPYRGDQQHAEISIHAPHAGRDIPPFRFS